MRARARDLGVVLGSLEPGPLNAITDVAGVNVGHTTVIEDEDVRTGVTVVVPPLPVFAAPFRLNGNGEMTGLEWVQESGLLTTPIAITNTHSVGAVHEAIVASRLADDGDGPWALPVVAETWDGVLNDVNGFHVRAHHVREALDSASDGPVAEGNVGGGTGMICHGWKGGIGTSSRLVGEHVLGVLVQANHGAARRLVIDGVPVGEVLTPPAREPVGSIIVLVATDAPLLPHQCARVAARAAIGIGRTGGAGENSSGDLVLALSTQAVAPTVRMRPNAELDGLFYAAIEATEEAIVNALLAAETMTGRRGVTVHALDPDALVEVMRLYGRLRAPTDVPEREATGA